jgi:hypothetical protein
MDALDPIREAGGDGGLGIVCEPRDIGGDGGLVTGGLRTRFVVLIGCGAIIVSFKQSCDSCKDDDVGRSGDERGSLMLCARATLALFIKFSFLGGGNGFCDGTNLGTMAGFTNPLGITSGLLPMESVVLCPCFVLNNLSIIL